MKRDFKVVEPSQRLQESRDPYQEVAVFVRDLLNCDCALVALTGEESIRIQAFAGRDGAKYGSLTNELLPRLRDWGPVVIDDARLITVPVSCDGRVKGLLIGYSSKCGTFTTEDLEQLMAYAPVASGVFETTVEEAKADVRTMFSNDELLHFFRLITMGEFSACFAHEVRNPLTLIRGHLRFIEESLTPDHPLRVNFEAIDRASRRIEEMTKRMLEFSKRRTRRVEACNVPDLIADALRFVQPYIRTKFIDVQVCLEPALPGIEVDRWQVVQCIVNLVQNAADAMMEVDHRVLSIGANAEDNDVSIVISDTGNGIAAANLSKLFEPFFTTKGDRGTGLGLYITKQVIEEHGGTIRVQTDNRATSFTLSLPLKAATRGGDS